MALKDIASTSDYGPDNPGQIGTGTILGHNISPMQNAQFGNPNTGIAQFNKLEDAAHGSAYGPFNTAGNPGTGVIPDQLGNVPPEIDFNSIP